MASFVKTNYKARRLEEKRRLCRRCRKREAVLGKLCGECWRKANLRLA